MSKTLEAGDPAPDIELATDTGERVKLSDFRGKTVVLFFYPKADTPGCTREACSFRDAITDYSNRDTVVLGISPDKPASQAKFKKKYELPYQLLADENKEAAEAFGVWAEKSFLGKKYMGVERTTFVIGPDGNIAKVFRKVKPAGHAAEVLSSLA